VREPEPAPETASETAPEAVRRTPPRPQPVAEPAREPEPVLPAPVLAATEPAPEPPAVLANRARPDGLTPPPRSRLGSRLLAALWLLLTLAGATLLVVGVLAQEWLSTDRLELPAGLRPLDLTSPWLPQVGAVVVATAYVWALAARTGGRPVVYSLLTVGIGVAVLWADRDVLRSGAAVMVCVVSAVLAVVATVPAVKLWQATREVVVAALVAALGGLATVGLQPSLDVVRFEYVSLGLAMVACFGVVYRLGAGFHGLGRRGVIVVVVGAVILGLTLAYAELLRRYGTPMLVEWIFDGVRWLRDHLGASPRPILAFLGVPALVWGTHMRARRRQGWWVCAFGVGATAPIAQLLIDPGVSRTEAGLATLYGLVLGLVVGALLIRADLAITGQRGRGARRAEEAAAVRPEPKRIDALL
jgi:hypothetical protein